MNLPEAQRAFRAIHPPAMSSKHPREMAERAIVLFAPTVDLPEHLPAQRGIDLLAHLDEDRLSRKYLVLGRPVRLLQQQTTGQEGGCRRASRIQNPPYSASSLRAACRSSVASATSLRLICLLCNFVMHYAPKARSITNLAEALAPSKDGTSMVTVDLAKTALPSWACHSLAICGGIYNGFPV
ncbi:hypothetical protein BKA62DRAFT_784286 [Auriculariales sp. MPI-PUGE-AT-0066]|nr:hypothetical protein BKA62DRAFT_784286 [Auriculariales sp. MPI-PUGE-AT-0066]